MPNLFKHLTSAPSIFIFGRRPKGSEAQPIFYSKETIGREKNQINLIIPSAYTNFA